jgi:hypothetical protein
MLYRAYRFCVLALFAVNAAHANPIITYFFNGTLATSINNQTSVTGQFTVDEATNLISDFSFQTPVGIIDNTHYRSGYIGVQPSPDPNGAVWAPAFVSIGNSPPFPEAYLALDFSGANGTRSFRGGPLYTGPVYDYPFEESVHTALSCPAQDPVCSPAAFSFFMSGSASPAAVTPEPATLSLLSCALAVAVGANRRQTLKEKLTT